MYLSIQIGHFGTLIFFFVMDATWRDLLVLLRGKSCVGVACEAIGDLAEQNIEVLPDLFHEVVFDLLVSNVTHVRNNGSTLLRILCAQFSLVLTPLLSDSCTDGVLFTIDDINIPKVLRCSGGQLRSSTTAGDVPSTVYTTSWLNMQVSELRTRIGLESNSSEVVDAAQYDNLEELLRPVDVSAHEERGAAERECSPHLKEIDESFPCNLNLHNVKATSETWFARLVRVMIVGLLSPTWEIRHGYALGLTVTLESLYPDLMHGQKEQQERRLAKLPAFLCDDMLCCGLCVLLLDRFMDFGCSEQEGSSVSPVKEAAGSMVACALQCADDLRRKRKAWELLVEMTTSSGVHWTVTLGGLIALKNFVRNNSLLVLVDQPELFASLVLRGVGSAAAGQEEVACCACEVLEALARACETLDWDWPDSSSNDSNSNNSSDNNFSTSSKSISICGQQQQQQQQHSVLCLLSALTVGIDEVATAAVGTVGSSSHAAEWEAPACLLLKLCVAVRSICRLVQSLWSRQVVSVNLEENTITVEVEVVLRLLVVQQKLVTMLFAYQERVRRRCLQMCLQSLQVLGTLLGTSGMRSCLTACPATAVLQVRVALFSLLGSLLCASCMASQFPCTDLQLEDSSGSGSGTGAGVGAGKSRGITRASQEEGGWSADLDGGSEASAVLLLCSAHHDHATMWKSLAEVCLEISHATSLSSSLELKRTTIAIQEVIEYTLRSSSSYSTTAGVNPTMSPLDGAEEYKSAITSFHAMLRSFLVREKERFACSAGSKGFSLLYAPKDCASVWDIATTARRGNLVTMLAALAVGSGHDCVDGLLRSVDTVVASEAVTNPAVVPRSVHPLSRIVGGGQQAVTAPKKRKFVIVSDVCEGPAASKRATVPIATPSAVPRATSSSSSLIPTPTSYSHIPPPDQQPQACSRSELLASLTLLVIDIQLQLQQHLALALAGGVKVPVAAASERVAGMRSSLQGALALCTCPGGELPQHPSAEVARALLAGDICSAMLVVSSGAFAASAAEDARVCLAAAAARVLLCSFAEDTNSGPERFRRLLTDLVAPTISGLVSSSFVNAMLFALLKISGEHIIQMFSVVLDCISSDRSPQSIWCLASALSACNRQVRRELVKKFDLLGVVFSSISQLSRASTVGESVSGAVEVLCLMTDPIDICATTYNNTGAAGTSVLAEGHAPTEYSEVDGHAISELLNIGTQLHRFLSRDSVQPLLLLPAESPPLARRNAAEVLHRLVLRRLEVVVHCYEVWFAAALQGIGDSDPCVRRCCVRAFRSLVPLASVAKRVSARRHLSEQPGASFASDDLIDHIFTKQSALKIQLSDQQRDQQIMAVLAAKTNLWVSSSSSLGSAALHLHPAQLRAYQWDGVSWLTQLRRFGLNGILADEMGLGKSLQALTALAIQRIEANFMTEPSLIVCPATLVLHWEDEIAHYFPSDLLRAVKYSSLTGSGATAGGGGGGVVLEGRDVVIASYEMVRRDVIKASGNGGTSLLSGRLWETVIADEAHLIKNPAAGTTKAVCSLQSKHRMALSGTPLQNQVEELWSLMNFVLPDYIGDYQTFRCDTVLPIQRSFSARRELKRSAGLLRATFEDASAPAGRKQRDSSLAKFHQAIEVSAVGLGLLRTLHKQVLPFILRRTKEMVAKDLPSKTIVDVLCPLSAQQAQLYDAHLRHLDLTDEQMEQELRLVEAEREADSSPISLSEPPDEIIDYEALKTAVAPVSSSNAAGPALALGGWGAVSSKIGLMMPALEDSAPPPPVRPRRNALESLNYLKLLGVHPALVVADGSYKARLLKSHTSSGKLLKLANLLLESGVMAREDFSPHRSLAELEGGNHSLLKGSADCCEGDGRCIDDEEEKEESGEAVQEMCVDGLEVEQGEPSKKPTAKNGKGKEKTTKEGKGSTKKKTKKSEEEHAKANSSERIVASATADHACRSAHNNADLLPPTHRCLIFAQHRAALDLVEEHVLQRYFPEVGYQRLDGSVDAAKRAAIARKFNSQERRSETVAGVLPLRSEQEDEAARTAQVQLLKGKLPAAALQRAPVGTTDSSVDKSSSVTGDSTGDIRVLLLTTRACGLGLNLTAADTVIFLEHDWNPFADLQAMDRVHRLGQTHPVTVYRLLAESTVEARIMRLQGLKRNIVDQVINEDNAGDRGGNGGDEGGAASGSSSGGAGGGSNGHGGGSSKQFGAVLMESLLHV